MQTMTIYYVDPDKANRDDRWDASLGKFIGEDKLTKVATYEATTENPLDEVFQEFNIGCRGGYPVRSMSVGDVVTMNNQAFLCAPAGWKEVDASF